MSRTVLAGAIAVGEPRADAVLAEHQPMLPGGEVCRCGWMYRGGVQECPAVLLARAGLAEIAGSVRILDASDDPVVNAIDRVEVEMERLAAVVDRLSVVVDGHAAAIDDLCSEPVRWPGWWRFLCDLVAAVAAVAMVVIGARWVTPAGVSSGQVLVDCLLVAAAAVVAWAAVGNVLVDARDGVRLVWHRRRGTARAGVTR
jgi:hypothetical protein